MARSRAKKQRTHIVRNGGSVPGFRNSWQAVNPVTKTTPTLKQRVARQARKHKNREDHT
jgi:hypothetical protein